MAPPPAPADQAGTDLARRVLVVDADREILNVLTQVIRRSGMEALPASNASEAERIATNLDRLDLAVVDVELPGLSGYQLAQRLRALPSLADSPLAILSMAGGTLEKLKALSAGAKYFFGKPFDPIDLRRKLRRIVGANGIAGHADLRVFPRLSVSLPVGVRRFKPGAPRSGAQAAQQVRNVSASGLCLLGEEPYDTGESLRVEFTLPEGKQPFKAFAEVVWSRSVGTGHLIGVQYLLHAPEEFVPLADFVHQRRFG